MRYRLLKNTHKFGHVDSFGKRNEDEADDKQRKKYSKTALVRSFDRNPDVVRTTRQGKLHYTSSTSSSEEEEERTVCLVVLSQLRKNSHDKFGWASMKHYRSFKLSMSYSNYSIVSGNIHGQYGRFVQRPVTVEDVVFREVFIGLLIETGLIVFAEIALDRRHRRQDLAIVGIYYYTV